MKLLIILFFCTLTWFACKKETPTGPPLNGVDTTSHNFMWHADTLGDGNASSFYDVAIINDSLAYAVGEIYKRDSVGIPIIFNLAKWNGTDWELKRVTVNNRYGLVTPPIEGIFAVSQSEIWLAAVIAIHGDGNAWTGYDIRTQLNNDSITVSKCWGKDQSDMYFVGRLGTVVHYTNGTWQRIESNTRLPINDIWGTTDQTTGQQTVICIAAEKTQNRGKKVLRVTNNSVAMIPDVNLTWSLSGVWLGQDATIYVVGGGLFQKNGIESNEEWNPLPGMLTPYYLNAIRGSGSSIAVVGDFGTVLTYNGATWRNHNEELSFQNSSLHAVALKSNLLIAVGEITAKGLVIIGKRTK